MRIVLFYSDVESFNYFTEQLDQELRDRGHETFILDLRHLTGAGDHSLAALGTFASGDVDVVISFDGLGIKDDLYMELWNQKQSLAVNILMDHPLRFHPTMEHHPDRYLQYCCDENHVAYVKEYFGEEVANVHFMPHAGTVSDKPVIPLADRKYDLLFSGTYYDPESYWNQIDEWFPRGGNINEFYHHLADYLKGHSHCSTEQAVREVIRERDMEVSDSQRKILFRCSEPVDWMVRMYQRERVIRVLADAGVDLWLLGRGWGNHPSYGGANVHWIEDRIPFGQTFSYMADARLNLNVMPWFKAGTHDRIFNVLLQHSLPVTDASSWIDAHYQSGEELAIYDLEHLEELPDMVKSLLADEGRMNRMIEQGYEKTLAGYTWRNCVDQILADVSQLK